MKKFVVKKFVAQAERGKLANTRPSISVYPLTNDFLAFFSCILSSRMLTIK